MIPLLKNTARLGHQIPEYFGDNELKSVDVARKIHCERLILEISHGRYGIDEGRCQVIEGYDCRSRCVLRCNRNRGMRIGISLPPEEQGRE